MNRDTDHAFNSHVIAHEAAHASVALRFCVFTMDRQLLTAVLILKLNLFSKDLNTSACKTPTFRDHRA